MSFLPCPSPPPPMPSPVLVPTPLPSPPPFTKRPSRRHLATQKTLNHALSHDALHYTATSPKAENSASRTLKRTLSQIPSRCRSPPPSPAIRSPPPPVPPIPAFVLTTHRSSIGPSSIPRRVPALDLYLDPPREDRSHTANACRESQAGGALGCMRFFAVHNPTGQCHA